MPDSRQKAEISSITQAKHGQSITLQRAGGDQIQLTASNLAKWFARIQLSLENKTHVMTSQEIDASTPGLATKFLSMYGLRQPIDVIRFLKSPGGEKALAAFYEALAEKAVMLDHLREQLTEQQRLEDLQFASMLLAYTLGDEAQVARIHHEAELTIAKILKEGEKSTTSNLPSTPLNPNQRSFLEARLAAYTASINAFDSKLESHAAESNVLEIEIEATTRHIEHAAQRYALLHSHIDEIEQLLLTPPDGTEHLDRLHCRFNELTSVIDAEASDISQRIETGDHELAHEGMMANLARNLQLNAFQEMFSLTKKIAHHEGRYFLLPADKTVENLSLEDKENSAQAYNNLRPQLVGLRQLVLKNHQLELQAHSERKNQLVARRDVIRIEVAFLGNQLTKLQALRAKVQTSLTDSIPTLNSGTSGPTPSPNQSSYHRMILALNNRPLAQPEIDGLRACVANSPKAKSLTDQVNQLQPGRPMPKRLMEALLRHRDIGTSWLTRSAVERVKEAPLSGAVPKKEDSVVTYIAATPSPLSIVPKKPY